MSNMNTRLKVLKFDFVQLPLSYNNIFNMKKNNQKLIALAYKLVFYAQTKYINI